MLFEGMGWLGLIGGLEVGRMIVRYGTLAILHQWIHRFHREQKVDSTASLQGATTSGELQLKQEGDSSLPAINSEGQQCQELERLWDADSRMRGKVLLSLGAVLPILHLKMSRSDGWDKDGTPALPALVGTGRIYPSSFFLFSKDTSAEKKMAKG